MPINTKKEAAEGEHYGRAGYENVNKFPDVLFVPQLVSLPNTFVSTNVQDEGSEFVSARRRQILACLKEQQVHNSYDGENARTLLTLLGETEDMCLDLVWAYRQRSEASTWLQLLIRFASS
mgnify:CR=1 FL=1